MFKQASMVEFFLPEWLGAFAAEREIIPDVEERMAFVIDAARRNTEAHTGGPFASAIFERDTGRLVALGVNRVCTEDLSIMHAEIIALTLAQRKLGTYDLGAEYLPAHELVSSTEPCAMCLGAITWSGIRRVVVGARDEDAREVGFDEGPKPEDWEAELRQRGIEVICDVRREEAREVLRKYSADGGQIYNPRASE
jgi:tRNA(Arg) A34 adenosine deaminase TadA